MATVIQVKRGTASAWTSANTVLTAGEIGFESDTKKMKVGDGSTAWTSLAYTATDGDITAVVAGTGLSGGSTSGSATLAIDTSVVVDKTTAQTLTNKTLTSPVLTTPSISTMTTTGDILYASAANTPARLGIGSTDQVLTVSSGVPTWATPAGGGGMTLIATTTWDNSVGTYTYSSLGSYKHILITGQNAGHNQAAAQSRWNLRFNGDTSSIYGMSIMQMNGTSFSGTSAPNATDRMTLSEPAGSMISADNADIKLKGGEFQIFIPDYASSNYKAAYWTGGSGQDGTRCMSNGTGRWSSTSAITSITLFMQTGNFKLGTIKVYGVS
jgi:hypothetical protein